MYFAPWNWFLQWLGFYKFDLSNTYGYGGLVYVTKSKYNLECITNTLENLQTPKEKPYYYFQEMQYYLNAIKSIQNYYMAWHVSSFVRILPFYAILKDYGMIAMAILSIVLQIDAISVPAYEIYVPHSFPPGSGETYNPDADKSASDAKKSTDGGDSKPAAGGGDSKPADINSNVKPVNG